MIDFSDCEFINQYMKYYTFYDFCDDREMIKFLFQGLDHNVKRFYLWYVYANIHMNETYKNAIWDYLNDNIDDEELLRMKILYKAK